MEEHPIRVLFVCMYKSIKQFYSSKEWQACRNGYYAKAKGLCERCLSKGIIKAGTEVHHIKRLTLENVNNPKIATNYDNLELLCYECHHAEHDDGKRAKGKRYMVDMETGKVYTR